MFCLLFLYKLSLKFLTTTGVSSPSFKIPESLMIQPSKCFISKFNCWRQDVSSSSGKLILSAM